MSVQGRMCWQGQGQVEVEMEVICQGEAKVAIEMEDGGEEVKRGR